MTTNPGDKFIPLSEQSGMCGGQGQISCDEANELIQDFLDKVTDSANGAVLQEHLGDCPPCESEFHVYQRIVESLARCRPDIPSETADRIKQYCEGLCSGDESAASQTSEMFSGEQPGVN
ncbi:MAG: zf-HC2 domain-containing protein [Microthrixaceae bacterium]